MSLSEDIAIAIAGIPSDLDEFARIGEICRRLAALPGVRRGRNTQALYCREHKIVRGPTEHLRGLEQKLQVVRAIPVEICPEPVSLIAAGPRGQQGILLVRYPACAGETLVPGEEAKRPFTDDALERFAADVRTLADHGYAHVYIRSWYHALVSSETGTIVMDDWGALSTGRRNDVTEMLGHLERLLAAELGGSDESGLPRGRS